ncbi:MAG: CNNM domain-containing protein [Gammaproteobacteria bacterium]|nr:CNNM domain-containing protein [Gammaproteobacteria bacterium]
MYTLLVTFFLVAIIVSFLCSLWEAVLLSITPSYAQIQLQKGTRLGRRLEGFKANIDRPLIAILTLNTIAHTVGAIGVGDQSAKIWAEANPLITGLAVPAAMTIGILILSEIIPKTIGANYWQKFAPFTVNSLVLIIAALWPLVVVCQFITRALKKDKAMTVFSRSDFLALAEIGAKEGVFKENEPKIIRNLLRFDTLLAKDVMTPRTVVKVAPEDMLIQDFFEQNKNLSFSRIPLHTEDAKEDITGYMLKNELLAKLVDGEGDRPLKSIEREILTVHERLAIPKLFSKLLEKREHIAMVVDEFGGLSGIVTMEDVIETMLGMEIVDELDNVEDMQALARKNWERRARQLGLINADDDTGHGSE